MTTHAAQLLRALGAGIIPTPTHARPTDLGGPGFASLLARARAGDLSTGRPVRVDDAASVDLTPGQLDRLARATDAADAAGARRLFAIIDGAGVIVDVPSRTVVRAVPLSADAGARLKPADVLTGVDAAAIVPPGDSDGAGIDLSAAPRTRADLAPLSGFIENGSLLDRLASPRLK
ncbi:MAG: hypothetical protein D6693_02560 [Planctomycetota bacterium]|nr:MAG: hypothetical protein D6693_02560 [Planctomycetota bacterium]